MTEAEMKSFLSQFEQAREEIQTWPQWMQDAAYEAAATMPTVSRPFKLPRIIKVLAEWEDKNGTLAGILEHEWLALLHPIRRAATIQSPRRARHEYNTMKG